MVSVTSGNIRAAVLGIAAPMLFADAAVPLCTNAAGADRNGYYTLWHDGGSACLRLQAGGYALDWRMPPGGNVVAGRGWARGSATRVVRYRALKFDPGSNGYLSLYGWSTQPLVEYYVVDGWGGFTPPGPGAQALGTIEADGATYRLYRTRRVDQPSIAGRATFDQYWSVRSERRRPGDDATISFALHVAGWRAAGMALGRLGYQVIAVEGYGSTGHARIALGTPTPAPNAGPRPPDAPLR